VFFGIIFDDDQGYLIKGEYKKLWHAASNYQPLEVIEKILGLFKFWPSLLFSDWIISTAERLNGENAENAFFPLDYINKFSFAGNSNDDSMLLHKLSDRLRRLDVPLR
jgi:hypothetical protein